MRLRGVGRGRERWGAMKTISLLALAVGRGVCRLLALLLALSAACAEQVFFTYEGGRAGLSRVILAGGQIENIEVIAAGGEVEDAFKLAWSPEARVLAAAVKAEDKPCLALWREGTTLRFLPLPAELSDLAELPTGFLAALSKGWVVQASADPAALSSEINLRQLLSPPGRKGEHLLPFPERGVALMTLQKDDDDSPALGNRLVLLGLDPLSVLADMPLPRDRPELHFPEERKEQGPGPEILVAIAEANTLAITLDLYGAVAFCDLDAALRGELRNYAAVPTSEDGSWGSAFPDRAAVIPTRAGPRLIVCNAGAGAGIAVFEPASRQKVAHFPAQAGADTPVIFPRREVAVTVVSGKLKMRKDGGGLGKSSAPGSALLVMDFSEPGAPRCSAFELGVPTLRVVQASEGNVLVFSEKEVLLVEVESGRLLDRKETPGPPVRAVFAP